MEAVLLFGPCGRDDRDLRSAAAKPDVAGFTFGWELEVTLESERLVERRRTRDVRSEDDRKRTLSDRKSIRPWVLSSFQPMEAVRDLSWSAPTESSYEAPE